MDKEAIYDELLSPLISQVIAICKEHEIPLACIFQLTDGESPMHCKTLIPADWQSERMSAANRLLAGSGNTALAITITKKGNTE